MNVAPHGNSKRTDPYVRTMPSVMEKLKTQSKNKTPKRALSFVSAEAGGIMEASSAGALPRNRQQVKDIRRASKQHEPDPLFAVLLMCKSNDDNPFVQYVNAAPFPMIVLAYDYTLHDIGRFCTQVDAFSVFGVDSTFTLGDFDVTITTYRHLLLQSKSSPSGKSPVMIGSIFVHMRKDFSAYHFFASSLVSLNPQIAYLKAFGTDGEAALEKALSTTFPTAVHVRCFLHFKGNIENKLRELGIPPTVAKEIICDVMGRASALEYGLVDAKDQDELEVLLGAVKTRWDELEKRYNNPPRFHSWFKKYCQHVIAESMVQDVRRKAGLGCPPEPYYTNEVESKNKLLKEEVQYKKSQLPDFIGKMGEMMHNQKQEIERAVLTSGEYRVREEYKHMTVATTKWFQMTIDQRNRRVATFMKSPIHQQATHSNPISDCPLSVISSLSKHHLEMLWSKAKVLAEDESAITQAPGDNPAWMVKSTSGRQPHYVKSGKTGGFICDDQCLSYKSAKICSHSVAMAL